MFITLNFEVNTNNYVGFLGLLLVGGGKSSTFAAKFDGNRGGAMGYLDARESGESPELYLQL